jgi:hypothetical protein
MGVASPNGPTAPATTASSPSPLEAAPAPPAEQSAVRFDSELRPIGQGPWALYALDGDALIGVLFDREGAEARPTEGDNVVMLVAHGPANHALRARIVPLDDATPRSFAWLGEPSIRIVRGHAGHVLSTDGQAFTRYYCLASLHVIEDDLCTRQMRVRFYQPRGLVLHGWTDRILEDRGTDSCPSHPVLRRLGIPRPPPPRQCPSPSPSVRTIEPG